MIDLKDAGVFKAVPRDEVPEELCAIMLDDEVVYVGQIIHAPVPPAGCTMYLNPKDFEILNAWFKKKKH